MSDYEIVTPVVFIIFNRPRETQRVFDEIAKAKPKKLFVIADGPRFNVADEDKNVLAARAVIQNINWDCEVLKNFSDVNLGCKARVSTGIDWVFEQVDEAIILEDDCVPDPTFFRFCQELLERYRYDSRISMISGDNFQFGYKLNNDSYYFSNINHIWGWATWRSRWVNDYDVEMSSWPSIREEGRYADWFPNATERRRFFRRMQDTYHGKIDTWDNQWQYASRLNGRISVMPNINLISNIGFGTSATHTKIDNMMANMKTESFVFPLKHPVAIFASTSLDSRFFTLFSTVHIWSLIKAKLFKLIGWGKR